MVHKSSRLSKIVFFTKVFETREKGDGPDIQCCNSILEFREYVGRLQNGLSPTDKSKEKKLRLYYMVADVSLSSKKHPYGTTEKVLHSQVAHAGVLKNLSRHVFCDRFPSQALVKPQQLARVEQGSDETKSLFKRNWLLVFGHPFLVLHSNKAQEPRP